MAVSPTNDFKLRSAFNSALAKVDRNRDGISVDELETKNTQLDKRLDHLMSGSAALQAKHKDEIDSLQRQIQILDTLITKFEKVDKDDSGKVSKGELKPLKQFKLFSQLVAALQ